MLQIVRKSSAEGRLFLTKLSAAERQLAASIRMYFMEEDQLAIHTVASAAYNIYSDLLSARGKHEAQWPLVYGLLSVGYDVAHGRLSEEEERWLSADLISSPIVQEVANYFRRNPEARPDDAEILGLDSSLVEDWHRLRRPANYLKHADRDPNKLLEISELRTEEVIFRAINSSLHLNAEFTMEKEYFYGAMYSLGKIEGPPIERVAVLALMSLEPEEVMEIGRRNLCSRTPQRRKRLIGSGL